MWKEFGEMIDRGKWVVLDTETTGLEKPAEIVDIAILAADGSALLNTLVCPKWPIPPAAINVHGITNEMVADAPCWVEVQPAVVELIRGLDVITYNAVFDRKMFHCSDEARMMPQTDYKAFSTWWCAMEWYAEFWGEWDEYHGNNRWQKLAVAVRQQGLPGFLAHRALDDAQATRQLIMKICLNREHSLPREPGQG